MKVQEIMNLKAAACHPEANLAATAALLWQNDCGALPVVTELGEVIGMITDRDICIALATRGQLASELTVADVFSHKVYTCKASDEIDKALKLMSQHKVRRLPVVNNEGILQGILSMSDLVHEASDREDRGLHFEDVIKTYRAICERPLTQPKPTGEQKRAAGSNKA